MAIEGIVQIITISLSRSSPLTYLQNFEFPVFHFFFLQVNKKQVIRSGEVEPYIL